MAGVTLEFAHSIELLPLSQRDRVPAGVLVRERDDRRQCGRTGDGASGRSGAREPVVFFHGIRGPLGALVDRTLADYQATGIADKLTARVVAHEMLAAAFRAGPVLFDHWFCRRAARHGMPSARWTSAALVNITRLSYTLSSWTVTTSAHPGWNGVADPFRTKDVLSVGDASDGALPSPLRIGEGGRLPASMARTARWIAASWARWVRTLSHLNDRP